MGALHEGHLSLVKRCNAQNDYTVVSIFVNPAQFNNPEDLEKYPRNSTRDLALLEAHNCDVVFMPSVEEMYPRPTRLRIDFGQVENRLEGAFRPGHFHGVGLVVSKLFNIVQPARAYFGQKDLQQYVIINQLVNDLSFPVSLHCEPIVREETGLAMSSRNERLTPLEREKASALFKALKSAEEQVCTGNKSFAEISQDMMEWLSAQDVRPEYFEIVKAEDLGEVHREDLPVELAICVAAFVGEVRLIDNIIIEKE
jgi:pantoate--beta-alanine ligase